ncbi:MAG: LPP20 family lipoprotein [Planctomycetes bacterium]|nr:LPP20 family lipoprotein [Planctomycetota bacterium]
MNRIHFARSARLVLLAIIALAGAACRDDRPSVPAQSRPDWIENPFLDGQFGAVGIATRSIAGEQQTIDQAMAAARTELARTLSSRIETAYKTAFNSSSDFTSGKHGGAQQVAHELTESVSKQLSNEVLRGSRRRALYTDPATGDHYVWVVVERDRTLTERISGEAQRQLKDRGIAGSEIEKRVADEIAVAFK